MKITKTHALVLFGLFIFCKILFECSFLLSAEKKPQPSKTLGLMVPHTKFSSDCGQCHLPKTWTVMRPDFHYDHKKETGYALEEAHSSLSCTECHNDRGLIAAYNRNNCAGCHQDPHKSTLGNDCNHCHTQTDWFVQQMPLADHAKTRFPLSGMHATISCEQCHNQASVGIFKGTPTDCYSCHQAEYLKAPNHTAFYYPHQCEVCHNASTFIGARFTHNFLPAGTDCYSCHSTEYIRAPQHVSLNLPHACGSCHNTTTFSGGTFDHSYLGSSPDCYSCHQTDYVNAPNHLSTGRSLQCTTCHLSTTIWTQTNN